MARHCRSRHSRRRRDVWREHRQDHELAQAAGGVKAKPMAYRKLSDAEIIKTWEECGNIRETSRRLKVTYNAIYKRLKRLNLIQVPFSDTADLTARTIPEGD